MRILMGRVWMVLVIAAACQTRLSAAEEGFLWVSGDGNSATLVSDEKPAAPAAPCTSCGEAGCDSCNSCDPCAYLGCEGCPRAGIVGIFGMDSFKGISDGSYQSNFGALAGVNAAMPLLGLGDRGFGWQLGMTAGIYDLDGRSSTTVNRSETQRQTFVTTGFFRKGDEDRRLSYGLVYDWMLNDNWGVYGTSPTLGQWRGQVEYALSNCNAVGMYGCVRDLGSEQRIRDTQITVGTRAMSQFNVFWHHKFCSGADSRVWVGAPERERLNGDGSLGDWLVGANVEVPLSERLALYGNAEYVHPSAAAGATASIESSWNVGMGILWYFGGNARSQAINGKCGLPYMPMANNSNFLVDQSSTF